ENSMIVTVAVAGRVLLLAAPSGTRQRSALAGAVARLPVWQLASGTLSTTASAVGSKVVDECLRFMIVTPRQRVVRPRARSRTPRARRAKGAFSSTARRDDQARGGRWMRRVWPARGAQVASAARRARCKEARGTRAVSARG